MCLAKTNATPCYTDLYDVASMRRKDLKQTEEGMQRDRVMEVGGTAEIGVGAGQRKGSSLVASCRVCMCPQALRFCSEWTLEFCKVFRRLKV